MTNRGWNIFFLFGGMIFLQTLFAGGGGGLARIIVIILVNGLYWGIGLFVAYLRTKR